MSVYLHWGEKQGVYNRENLFYHFENHERIATSKLCANCKIYDTHKQKCTHPLLGCESNSQRVRPWEYGIICPLKIKS